MQTNAFNYRVLAFLGQNMSPQASRAQKLIRLAKNIAIPASILFCFELATVYYIWANASDVTECLIASFQVPAFLGVTLAYVELARKGYLVNEIFSAIESSVGRRMQRWGREPYEKAIKASNSFVKGPLLFISGSFACNAIGSFLFDIISAALKGELLPNEWFLPYRLK